MKRLKFTQVERVDPNALAGVRREPNALGSTRST